jgi:endonuclease III
VVEEGVDHQQVAADSSLLSDDFAKVHVGGDSSCRGCRYDPDVDERALDILHRLERRYPKIGTALRYTDPWQLLVATVLSAQTTDDTVNKVTPELFKAYPTPEDLGGANPEEVEKIVFTTGFFRQKTKAIIGLSQALTEQFDSIVPADLDQLVTLPGVGRKTASVVLAEAFGVPAIAVDTHVKRLSNRLGFTTQKDPDKIEQDLKELFPESAWAGLSMRLIQYGRDVCTARRPNCLECELSDVCPFPDKTAGG